LTLICQQINEEVDRSVKTGIGESITPDQLLERINTAVTDAEQSATDAGQEANRAEVAAGNLFQRANPPFVLVDGQSDYALTYPVNPIERNAAVFISGVFQENTATNYTFPDQNTIRFIGDIPSGATAQVLTSLSAANPDLSQAIQDTIDFQDAHLVRDNVSKVISVGYQLPTSLPVAANPPLISSGRAQELDVSGTVNLAKLTERGVVIIKITGAGTLNLHADYNKINGSEESYAGAGGLLMLVNDGADQWFSLTNKGA